MKHPDVIWFSLLGDFSEWQDIPVGNQFSIGPKTFSLVSIIEDEYGGKVHLGIKEIGSGGE